ncbi:MAG: DUF6252 family protein [Flavobacteriaceae bacterium]|nr:DUF6252 family protein [Flavobacteriaceae bacterium]
MKKNQILKWIFIAFVAFQFNSCDNEPLEGVFPGPDDPSLVEEGSFIATIGSVFFTADEASGNLNQSNILTLTGTISSTGEKIVLVVENPAVGIFNLDVGLGTDNSASYFETGDTTNPYFSTNVFGATSELEITEYDITNSTITGTFNFEGARIALDSDGNPILDGQGNPTIETENISSGAFNKIAFTNEDEGGGSTPIQDEFFAKVDGVDFVADAVTTTLNEIFGVSVVKIVAVNGQGQIMRIDIPEDLGVGTFAMESLSDGTKLISLYNPATGGENLTSNPGTITITRFNINTGIIEATFNFTASDPINIDPTVAEITEGSFKVDYIAEPGDVTSTFTAEVDGVFYNPDLLNVGESQFNGITRFTITTVNSDTGERMGLFFPTDIEIGTYEMDMTLINGTEIFSQYTPEFGVSSTFISNPGTLTIIDYDADARIIEGTFSYTATDQLGVDPTVYEITTGEFTLEY